MKSRLTVGGLVLLGLLGAAATGLSQEGKDKAAKAAMEHAKPGPVHQQLAKRAGEYTTVAKFWFKPGDQPTEETKGTAKITSILGGRFLSEENSGTMMGQPFTALRLVGYNSATQQYEATWVFTGSTATMTLVGTSKDDGKTIHWTGTYEHEKGTKATVHVETRYLDDDRFVVELSHKAPDGSKGPTLETTYTRKK
jgi:hypothetical protein